MLRLLRFCFLLLLTLPSAGQSTRSWALHWPFPISRPHAGPILGNGTQGLLVWGQHNQLNITVGRAGFWDHRGGNDFTARTTYADVKRLLLARDEPGIQAAFAQPKTADTGFGHPQQLGGGRLEIIFQDGITLTNARLVPNGLLFVEMTRPKATNGLSATAIVTIGQAHDEELTEISVDPALVKSVRLVPAGAGLGPQMQAAGIAPPTPFATADVSGFVQSLPQDQPLTMAWRQHGNRIYLATGLGHNQQQPLSDWLRALGRVPSDAVARRGQRTKFWNDYWASVPYVQLPDPAIQEIIDYGLYRQACATPPQGVACALQGPFMEDYQLIPWSNDYHFNINVEMIYLPALATNRLSHFGPLWRLIRGWMPALRQNGQAFFARPGAMMLPHAVDDRCRVVGTFWTGTIDHACTAWMAQLAWQHYRYGLDQPDSARQVLQTVAWPLLVGAFEGYYAMLEEIPDSTAGGAGSGQKRWSLPISVSPEYGGSGMNAYGRDASFQLAALHRICRILPDAARALGLPLDPRWADVDRRLPPYTTVNGVYMSEWNLSNERIALWQGQDLVGSHRHHSHLAGIYPFQTIDLNDPAQRKIVDNSLTTWRYRGAGGWSGWCVPWASVLLARTGQTEAAVNWLHYWTDNFTNEGRGTLHNANNNGNSIIGAPDWTKQARNGEVMQLDGGFGALSAALELLVQCREDAIYVLPDRPRTWRNLHVKRIRTDGAFQVGATVQNGRVTEVNISSLAGGPLRVVLPFEGGFRLNGVAQPAGKLTVDTRRGQVLVCTPM